MASFKSGDRVRVVTRDVTPEDPKSGLYFAYLGGLTGSVDRVYDDGSVCVDVDIEALGEEVRERHLAMQEAERTKWLAGLSDEVRNRLTAEQKQLKMSYRILVSHRDLEPHKGPKPSGAKPETKTESRPRADQSADAPNPPQEARASLQQGAAAPKVPKPPPEEKPPRRLSEADLSAAEEAFLRSRTQGK